MIEEKKKVLVFGSKPKFTTPLGSYDVAYFANAAIGRASIVNAKENINIISSYLENPTTSLISAAKSEIDKSVCDKKIVLGRIYDRFRFFDRAFINWHWVSFKVINLIGFSCYFKKLFSGKGFLNLISEVRNLIFKGYAECLKPSTGIVAVIYA